MSFNLNPLNGITPEIKASQIKDGHGGNAGYFKQNKKDGDNEETKSIFNEDNHKQDTFSLKDAEASNYSDPPMLLKILENIKAFINKLFNLNL